MTTFRILIMILAKLVLLLASFFVSGKGGGVDPSRPEARRKVLGDRDYARRAIEAKWIANKRTEECSDEVVDVALPDSQSECLRRSDGYRRD
ncbi:hypothetical protein [uncultured Cohaesibacter sp.]|uniref:hypothetical protein n=1 Tax=uncultured Cohaesibacter sp. TaxID=1002546 RepID=UPI0029C9A770|nr:hypothetical protein [uncultured Cohaesibacter sp.]